MGRIDYLEGKTVIQSDHGNLLEERSWPIPLKTYTHPEGLRISDLITVPRAIIDDDRREITDDGTEEETPEKDKVNNIEEKLKALGYV